MALYKGAGGQKDQSQSGPRMRIFSYHLAVDQTFNEFYASPIVEIECPSNVRVWPIQVIDILTLELNFQAYQQSFLLFHKQYNGVCYMRTYRFSIKILAVLLLPTLSTPAQAYKFIDTIEIYKKSEAVQPFFKNAYGYAVFPTMVAITAGVQAKAGTEGATAGASAGPATGKQAKASYHKGMAVFVHTKGGLMYEAAIGGQKFNFKPNQ